MLRLRVGSVPVDKIPEDDIRFGVEDEYAVLNTYGTMKYFHKTGVWTLGNLHGMPQYYRSFPSMFEMYSQIEHLMWGMVREIEYDKN